MRISKSGFRGRAPVPLVVMLALGSGMRAPAAAQDYPHAREPIGSVRQVYDGTLTPDLAVNTFRNIDRLFPSRTIEHGDKVLPLPPRRAAAHATQVRLARKALGFVRLSGGKSRGRSARLKEGRVALELYQYGNTAKTRWMSMSVAKSITSTLIGAAIKQGYIGSIEDPVTKYVPTLAGSAYEGVSIRNLLMMSSGVRWNETYTDPTSDRRRLLEAQIAQRPGAALELDEEAAASGAARDREQLQHGRDAGCGRSVHNAVKRSLSEYLSERIWKPVWHGGRCDVVARLA